MTTIWVESISVFGPGLLGWPSALGVLKEESLYEPTLMPSFDCRFLSPNNKRRTSPHMHVAIQAAEQAIRGADVDETAIDLIFTTSECDLDIAEDGLQALTKDTKELSPQKFQNVILNAASGHLGVFMKNCSGSTSLSGHGNIFSIALLEAYTTLIKPQKKTLLVVYDAASDMAYAPKDCAFFGVGLVLSNERSENSLAGLSLSLTKPTKPTPVSHKALEHLRSTTPAAACLPLLSALAKNQMGIIELTYTEEHALSVTLCF